MNTFTGLFNLLLIAFLGIVSVLFIHTKIYPLLRVNLCNKKGENTTKTQTKNKENKND